MSSEGQEERELGDEIEIARHALGEDIERESSKAEENLDRILSRKDMEFCSRCGRTVEGRMDWAGKCLKKGCENLLCRDCWAAKRRRFCMEHYKQMVAKRPEEESREKIFFRGEGEMPGEEIIEPELGELKEGREVQRIRERAELLSRNYASFLETRFGSEGAIDFNPEGFFGSSRMEKSEEGDEVWIRVFTKKLLGSRERLWIIIKPIYSDNANYLVSKVQERLKGVRGYPVIVLVGEKGSSSNIAYVNRFDNRQVSLFLVEPGEGRVFFNDKIPINRLYSVWFNQGKNPLGFQDVLKSLADRVSNRWVVSSEKVSEAFGYTRERSLEILKSCDFLSPVPDTDQYLFREGKG